MGRRKRVCGRAFRGAPQSTPSPRVPRACELSSHASLTVLSFRLKVYNPRIRANSLVTQPISQSQADARKQVLGSSPSGSPAATEADGRARTQATRRPHSRLPRSLPGKLFCLYSEDFASKDMRPLKPAEMQEANLTSMVLFLKRVDIAGLGHCDFMNRPGSFVLGRSGGARRRRGPAPRPGRGLRAGGTRRCGRGDLIVTQACAQSLGTTRPDTGE